MRIIIKKKETIFSVLFALLMPIILIAQVPNKISYQAVIRNVSNNLVVNMTIGMQVSIIQGSASGSVVFKEKYSPNPITNMNGLVSIDIGGGVPIVGNFDSINWANGPYHIKTEIDPLGGTNYSILSVSQLLSVPYALYAKTSGSSVPGPQGPAGVVGAQGPVGPIGQAGVGITNTYVQRDSLIVELSSSQKLNAGNVRGLPGIQGPSGNNGQNGVGISSSFVQGDSLYILMNDSQKLNAGYVRGMQGFQGNTGANGAKGVGIINSYVQNDSLLVVSSDSLIQNKGKVVGPIGLQGMAGAIGIQGIKGPGGFVHHIGDQYGGGVIFALWKDSLEIEHGLIVTNTNLSVSQKWSNINTVLIGAGAQSTFDGLTNSNSIISQPGHLNSAAKLCLDTVLNSQNDWYLPSVDELSLLFHNRFLVNKKLSVIPGASTLTYYDTFWSSTEYFANVSWCFNFGPGGPAASGKLNERYVRAIRAF